MAKSKGAFLSIEANGKLGTMIAYRNQWGQIIREVPEYTDPETEQQLSWRSAVGYLSGKWKTDTTITDPLRYMWRDFGLNWPSTDRFGKQIHLSARDWFIKLNVFRRMAGLGYHKAPPKFPSCTIEPVVTFSQVDEGIFVDIDNALIGDDILWISAVPDQNVSRLFMPRTSTDEWFLKSSTTFPYKLYANADLPADNKRIFFKYRPVDGSGRAAPARVTSLIAQKRSFSDTIYIDNNTTIIEEYPDTNYYNIERIQLDGTSNVMRKGLLQFDFSSLPSWSKIVSANLFVYFDLITSEESIYLYRMIQEWLYTQSTWNIAYTGLPWSSPGMLSGSDYYSTPLDSINISLTPSWYALDISQCVQDFVDGTYTNYGFCIIQPTGTLNRFPGYLSSNPDYIPYVSITYA